MLLWLVTGALGADLKSGAYGELRLGVDPVSHEISGAYFSATGDDGKGNPQFTCAFTLRATAANGPVTVQSGPDRLTGTLAVDGDAVTLTLPENPPGCGNVQPFIEPVRLTLTAAQPWTAVRSIAADRAWFADAPDTAPRKVYVVKGDVVVVFEAKGKSVRAAYTGATGRTTTGWIPVADLAPLP